MRQLEGIYATRRTYAQGLTALQQQGMRYRLDEIERLCPDPTCTQVLLAVDYLVRSDQACLTLDSNRTYWVNV